MIPVPVGRACLIGGRRDRHAARHERPSLQVQEALRRDPHGGHLYVFRGRRGDLIKVLWSDAHGVSLYA